MTEQREQDDWLRFELTDDEVEEYSVLREDIPDWLETSLWEWVKDSLTAIPGSPLAYFDNALVRKCELKLRVRIPYNLEDGRDLDKGLRAVRHTYQDRPVRDVWRLVNYLLYAGRAHGGALKTVLLDAGSVWTVEDYKGKCYLERRLPTGVRDTAERIFRVPNGGERLAEAWRAVFGVDPDPSWAYSLAIRAVEDASIRVVCPKKDEAVLGDVIGELISNSKWKMPHQREHDEAPPREVLVSMLRMIYRGQHDRHGGVPVPLPDMTQEEAESAVLLAATLVGWFATGKVTKT